MSFILDALRKSGDRAPARQSGPSMAEFPAAREDRRLPVAPDRDRLPARDQRRGRALLHAAPVARAGRSGGSQVAAAPPASVTSPPPASAARPPAITPVPQSELQAAQDAPGPVCGPAARALWRDGDAAARPRLIRRCCPMPGSRPRASLTASRCPTMRRPVEAATGLPALTVDLHIYANDPAKRAIFINGRRYTQGAHTGRGPDRGGDHARRRRAPYRGRRFQLPRL